MTPYGIGSLARDDRGQGFRRGLLDIAQASEMGQQALPGERPNPGYVEQFGISISYAPSDP